MVVGLDLFREHFSQYADQYILIGGAATYMVLDEAGLRSRATKDLDIVLCAEALDTDFARRFWMFVNEGGYQNRQRSTGEKVFYRFYDPADEKFPAMLELFSRDLEGVSIADDTELTPVPFDDEVASLSAILLDPDYYGFLHSNKRNLEGIPLASEVCLIPFKARAYLDLRRRKANGERVGTKEINKHRGDVLRLHQLLAFEQQVTAPKAIRDDLIDFLTVVEDQVDDRQLNQLGIRGTSVAEIANTIRAVYELGWATARGQRDG